MKLQRLQADVDYMGLVALHANTQGMLIAVTRCLMVSHTSS